MHHLGEGNIPYLEVAQTGANNSATHVVTEIQYGAEATFTFRKRFNETEDQQIVNGQLNICGNKLVKVLLGAPNAPGAIGSESAEHNNYTDVECQFEGDFKLPDDLATPTNYDEAIKFARQFSHVLARSMVKDERSEPLGVPCSVSLYPLGLLHGVNGAPVLAQEISETTASMCVQLIEDYDDLEEEIADLLNDSLVGKLRPLRKKLEFFQQHFSAFRAKLKLKLRNILVQIRSGEEEISSLEKLLNYIRTNNFFLNPDRIALWLEDERDELRMVKRFRDKLASKLKNQERILFFPKKEVLQEQMFQSTVRDAIHFVFTSLRIPDPFLELVTQQTPAIMDEIGRNTQPVDVPSCELWYRDKNIVDRIEQELMDFHGFIEANTRDQGLVFAMTALDEDLIEPVNSGASIFVYQKGILQERNYELPTEPHSVIKVKNAIDRNLKVSFSAPRGNIMHYKIEWYRPCSYVKSKYSKINSFTLPFCAVAVFNTYFFNTVYLYATITAECIYGSGPPHAFVVNLGDIL